eukprot:scaffold22931_cov101-Isochrysis_galbana.AAC.1
MVRLVADEGVLWPRRGDVDGEATEGLAVQVGNLARQRRRRVQHLCASGIDGVPSCGQESITASPLIVRPELEQELVVRIVYTQAHVHDDIVRTEIEAGGRVPDRRQRHE